jgi:DNA-binding transcriptional MerR regulator
MATYTPAQTVERSGFSIETLRYYEHIGLLGRVQRNASGHRVFSDGDLEWLGVLRCLRDTGMPIADMRRYAEHVLADADETVPDRLALLEEHAGALTEHMARLHRQREHLEEKIAHYRGLLRRPAAGARP